MQRFKAGSIWRLPTGSYDDTAKVWDVGTGKELLTLGGQRRSFENRSVTSVAWSPDGKRLASGNADGTAKVWDIKMGTQ